MALSNDILLEQPNQLSPTKTQQTSLPILQESQAGPSQQWAVPPSSQEYPFSQTCLYTSPQEHQANPSQTWLLPPLPQECLLYQQDGGSQTTKRPLEDATLPPSKRPHPPDLEHIPSPFRAQVALDQLRQERGKSTIKRPKFSPVISTPPSADPKGKLLTFPVSTTLSLPGVSPLGSSNGAPTEWKTWRDQIHSETAINPPEVQQLVAQRPAPRRRRATGRVRPRPRQPRRPRAPIARSAASSIPESRPIPVPYRPIRNAHEKPIYWEAEHNREGLAGMIGVAKEEWDMGLRTPVYAPPSDGMWLRELQRQSKKARKYPWLKQTEEDLKRRKEEVELTRRVHAEVAKVGWEVFTEKFRREEVMGVPISDELVLRRGGVEVVDLTFAVDPGLRTDKLGGEAGKDGEGVMTLKMPGKPVSRSTDGVRSRGATETTSESSESICPGSGETSQFESDGVDLQPMEGVEGVAGESGENGIANLTPPAETNLKGEDAMDVAKWEGTNGIAEPTEPISPTKDGAPVGRSNGTAVAPIYVDSSFAGEDASAESDSSGGWFTVGVFPASPAPEKQIQRRARTELPSPGLSCPALKKHVPQV